MKPKNTKKKKKKTVSKYTGKRKPYKKLKTKQIKLQVNYDSTISRSQKQNPKKKRHDKPCHNRQASPITKSPKWRKYSISCCSDRRLEHKEEYV